jgi:hypothetical protein
MGRDSTLAGGDWLLTASDKALVTLRAFKVLRVNVRSLFWCCASMRAWGAYRPERAECHSCTRVMHFLAMVRALKGFREMSDWL